MLNNKHDELRKEESYAFRGSIPGKAEVSTTSFVLHSSPIAPAAMGSLFSTKSAAPTPLFLGMHPLNAYEESRIGFTKMLKNDPELQGVDDEQIELMASLGTSNPDTRKLPSEA